MNDRRRSSRRRSSSHRHSTLDVDDFLSERQDDEILQLYTEEDETSSEEEIFENIKRQKEIIEQVRMHPWNIRRKLKMLGLAKEYVEKHEGKLSKSHGYQEKGAKAWRQFKRAMVNFMSLFIPWEMRIKRIESHFGSVVASYFIFLRWIFWINIWLTILPVCFIIVPEVIAGALHGSTDRKAVPAKAVDTQSNLKTIWDAEGIIKYSPLFYGYYGNDEVIGTGYRLPIAYFFTGVAAFAYSFVVVLRKMASNARMSKMSNKDEQFTFSWKLFASWDFMIGSTETANNKNAAIITTFRESIIEEEEKQKEGNKYLLIFLRVIANFLCVLLLAGSTYAIQLCVERSRVIDSKKATGYVANFWEENEVTVVMTLISTLFPNIFDLISVMEKYHPRINLRVQLARIFVLNLINLYTLFIALFWKQQDLKKQIDIILQNSNDTATYVVNVTYECPVSTDSSTMGMNTMSTSYDVVTGFNISSENYTASFVTATVSDFLTSTAGEVYNLCTRQETLNRTHAVASELCWETMIGQEVYKLTVMDLLFASGQILIVDYLRGLFVRYCNKCWCWDMETSFPEYGEFKTAENLLHLINNQGMIWLGTFFAPGLPPLNMLKLLVLVYMRCWSVMACNVPQERIFRASRSNNFYYSLLLVMLFLCIIPTLFAIVAIEPSPNCGPFSGRDRIYSVVIDTMDKEFPPVVNTVLSYIASPGVIIPVFLLMVLSIYYLLSTRRSLVESNNDLMMKLDYERTEGRRKVYAMADAKRDLEDGSTTKSKSSKVQPEINIDDVKKSGRRGLRSAASSVMAAAQMARMMVSSLNDPKTSKKLVSTKPDSNRPPVAVVTGSPVSQQNTSKETKRNEYRTEQRKKNTPTAHVSGTPNAAHVSGTPNAAHVSGTPNAAHVSGTPNAAKQKSWSNGRDDSHDANGHAANRRKLKNAVMTFSKRLSSDDQMNAPAEQDEIESENAMLSPKRDDVSRRSRQFLSVDDDRDDLLPLEQYSNQEEAEASLVREVPNRYFTNGHLNEGFSDTPVSTQQVSRMENVLIHKVSTKSLNARSDGGFVDSDGPRRHSSETVPVIHVEDCSDQNMAVTTTEPDLTATEDDVPEADYANEWDDVFIENEVSTRSHPKRTHNNVSAYSSNWDD